MTFHLAVNPAVDWLTIEGEVLVYDGELLHFLPSSAAEIWHALEGRLTLDDLVSLIAKRHPESPEAPGEIADFVAGLVRQGLVVERDEPKAGRFKVPAHVAWTVDANGSVALVDLRDGSRESLSAVASSIWTLAAAGSDHQTLISRMSDHYPEALTALDDTVEQFLETLVARGLLERSSVLD